MIYLMYLSGIFMLRISISLRPSWKHSLSLSSSSRQRSRAVWTDTLFLHTRKENNPTLKLTCPSSQPFQGEFQNWQCTCRVSQSNVFFVTSTIGVFDVSEALILRANKYPEDEDKAQFTASWHANGLASSWQFCLWLWEMMGDHEIHMHTKGWWQVHCNFNCNPHSSRQRGCNLQA